MFRHLGRLWRKYVAKKMTKNDVLYFQTIERQRAEDKKTQNEFKANIPYVVASIEGRLNRHNVLNNVTSIEIGGISEIFYTGANGNTRTIALRDFEKVGLVFELANALRDKGYGVSVETGIGGIVLGMRVSL